MARASLSLVIVSSYCQLLSSLSFLGAKATRNLGLAANNLGSLALLGMTNFKTKPPSARCLRTAYSATRCLRSIGSLAEVSYTPAARPSGYRIAAIH
jgi:hypothetical protein